MRPSTAAVFRGGRWQHQHDGALRRRLFLPLCRHVAHAGFAPRRAAGAVGASHVGAVPARSLLRGGHVGPDVLPEWHGAQWHWRCERRRLRCLPQRLPVQAGRSDPCGVQPRLLLQRLHAQRLRGGHLQPRAWRKQDRRVHPVSRGCVVQQSWDRQPRGVQVPSRALLPRAHGGPRALPWRHLPRHDRRQGPRRMHGVRWRLFLRPRCCGTHALPEQHILPHGLGECHHLPRGLVLPAAEQRADHLPFESLLPHEDRPPPSTASSARTAWRAAPRRPCARWAPLPRPRP